jgi:hypothetical protein
MPLGHRVMGEGPLGALLAGQVAQTQTEIRRYATQSFVTKGSDSPGNTYIPGLLARGLTIGRRLSNGPDGQFGSLIETAHGEITLINSDGQLDELVGQYHVDGRRIRLFIGAIEVTNLGRERVQPFSMFELVYTAVAGDWTHEHEFVRVSVLSLNDRLNNRMQPNVYSGTGGEGGTADMVGRTVPISIGRNLNVTAQILDPNILSYDVHSGAIESIDAVYDMGIAVTFNADYATYSALAAATIPPGQYSTSLAVGKFRLGSPPAGTVTVDLHGDIDNVNLGYVARHGSIIRMILRDYGGIAASELDLNSFTVFNDANVWEIGIFLPAGDQSTVIEVIERIALSGGAFVGQDRSGLMRVRRLETPAAIADWAFTDREIISIERLKLPYGVPWKAWGIGYQKNWTVQKGSDIAAGVTQDRRTFLESEFRYFYVQDTTIAVAHATSGGAIRDTLIYSPDGAEDEANRLIQLYSIGRAFYRVVVKTALFSAEIGQTVRLTYDRWDLQGGKNFRIISIFDDGDATTTELELFG